MVVTGFPKPARMVYINVLLTLLQINASWKDTSKEEIPKRVLEKKDWVQ